MLQTQFQKHVVWRYYHVLLQYFDNSARWALSREFEAIYYHSFTDK